MNLELKAFTPPPAGQTKPIYAAAVEGVLSLIINRRYWDVSDFELHAALTERNRNALQIGNLIYHPPDAYLIQGVELDRGSKQMTVTGQSLACLLADRYNLSAVEYADKPLDTICRELVSKNLISASRTFPDPSAAPYFAANAVPHLSLGESLPNTPSLSKQDSDSELLALICELCQSCETGFRVRFDLENWAYRFELFRGFDRTLGQQERPACVFSREYDTVLDEQYTVSSSNYKNVAFVKGEGEGDARKGVFVRLPLADGSLPEGGTAKELFVDARDLRQEEGMSDAAYRNLLEQRGREKLAERLMVETMSQTLVQGSSKQYRRDWNLGDRVTVLNREWGLQLDTCITEVQEVYEPSGETISPTLGNSVPTLTDKIKQLTKR